MVINMAVTIRDVAKRAGTSATTVSKVMNGSYSISQATADRVNQAMEELNYHPNLRARNFAKQSTKTVIFVTLLGKNVGFSNPHMFEIMCGLERALSEKGYSLIVKSITAEETCQYIRKASDTKLADGFVIHASAISCELDELVQEKAIPHLVIGTPNFKSHFCWIDIDNRLAGEIAAKHLLEEGYQSLAFIGGEETDKISMHRLNGVLSILNKHDVIVPRGHVQQGESVCDSGYRMTEQILDSKERPDAIICANNYIAYGCVNALHDKNISIPEDMGIVTFDDYPFSQILKPMLTVVNIDVFDMGMQAGKYILQKIKKPNLYAQSYITFPSVIVREST
ncbi:LacI family DNA-binding transcriptional regulator [Kineothrix sp. MB12-C1]|uniref:LacI family DNA-binding transcriptional regulator n=1 Tax=Kineothrix sp. MB12-C1 TaxID=3070215 RepID=UPI0027D26AEA|nr:LacI family DNA-binding transcriptional regulator [Kineothrix sp. MB12-C1]WMC94079.1 LacI family DNA-binding transcriptional regulator [Kineothrix sp. MB12-C1]